MRRWSFAIAAAVCLVAGCDSKPKEPPDVIKSQRQMMEKAKAVGEVLQKSADERRQQVDQQK